MIALTGRSVECGVPAKDVKPALENEDYLTSILTYLQAENSTASLEQEEKRMLAAP